MLDLSPDNALNSSTQFVKCGYYGEIGTAKTTNLAKLANLGRIVYIDAEAGLEPVPLRDLDVPTENIIPHQKITFDALDGLCEDLRAELYSNPTSIVGVNFDSMGEIVAALVEQTNDTEIERQIRKLERRGEDTSGLSKFSIDRSSWGVVTEMMRRLIRHYRDLPCHMGWAALERRDIDPNTGDVSYGPKVNPGLQGDLLGYVNVVLHTWVDGEDSKGNEMFVAHARKTSKYPAKDRFHKTPKRMAVPSFDRVVGYVHSDITVPTDPIQQYYHDVLRSRRIPDSQKSDRDKTGDRMQAIAESLVLGQFAGTDGSDSPAEG